MRRKIFKNNLLVGILIMILCVALFVPVLFRHYESQAFDRLDSELNNIAHGIELSGITYLDTLETTDRVTWIDADGEVLYDSKVELEDMQNHLDREEIRETLETGKGTSARWSETLMEYDLYSALRLNDGTIVRMSCTQSSVVALLAALLWPILGILLVSAVLCILLSYRLAGRIVEPINRIDLNHPIVDETYAELHPLAERIREQNHMLHDQMEEMKQKQQEFSALTDNMYEGFLLLDDHMNVLSGNSAAFNLLGNNPRLTNLHGDSVFPPVTAAVEGALTGIRTETVQKISGRSWQIIADPIVVRGQVSGVVVLLMDVTEQEQREQLRREFSANVSHELKTPLTSISGFAELLAKGLVEPEKTVEFSNDIYKESQRLICLVDDIIRLSRLDEGAIFESEHVDLYALCEEIIGNLLAVAEKKKVTFTLNGEHAWVLGAQQILHDMIYNLCDNAVKYNHTGGKVIIDVNSSEEHVTLCVSDTGIGIPYSEQSRVFERFYRVDKSHSKEIGGTGLGLSIVKHAVQYHHASISLNSIPGEGTKITVVF